MLRGAFAFATLAFLAMGAPSACAITGEEKGKRPGWREVEQGVAAGRKLATAAAQKPAGEVHNGAELLAVARDPASAGKTFLVRGGDYGDIDLHDVRHAATVTFRAKAGEQAILHYTTMGNTEGVRLEGLRFVDAIDIQPGTNRRIELVRNDIGGFAGAGISLREISSEILIAGNVFHDLRGTGGGPSGGYGIRASSPGVEISNLAILGNHFARLGNDAMEIGGVVGLRVERNRVSGVAIEPGSGAHADPLYVWAGTRDAVIRGNAFVGNSQPVYVVGRTANVLFENNLVAQGDNWCMQAGGSGKAGDTIQGIVIRNNTFWDCDFGGLLYSAADAGWTLQNNLIQSLGPGVPRGSIGKQSHNLIGKGPRTGTDLAGRVRFVNRAGSDYRLAPGSRGLDAATSEGAPGTDLLGVRRSDDPDAPNTGAGASTFYDIGAFERPPVPRLDDLGAEGGPAVSLTYTLSKRARVSFTILTRRGREIGSFVDRGRRGKHRTRLPRRLGGVQLEPGRYRVVARALDATGNPSKSRRAAFRLARR